MATHRYILSAGHRNTDRGGARGEIEWTYNSCVALREAIEARGGKAWIIQEEDGDDDPTFFKNGGLQQAAMMCVNLAKAVGGVDAYISSHYNGGASPGFHAIFPDAHSGGDVKANNPLDVRLCQAMRDRVRATNTVGVIGWTADSPGVMSEKETGVGAQGFRLGELVGTLAIRDTTARVIIEAGSIDVPRERAFINDASWVRTVYAEAIVDALEDIFGKFPKARPPRIPPETRFAQAIASPQLTRFVNTPEDAIPAAIKDGDQWYFWVGREVTVTKQTPRNQLPADDSAKIGPDLNPGERFFAPWASVAANGRPFAHTWWNTRIWLDDTNFGVLD